VLCVRTRVLAVGIVVAFVLTGAGGWAVVRRFDRPAPTVVETVKRVGDADPRLLPAKIPAGWRPVTHTGRSFFSVTYRAPGGQTWVRVAIALPNLPLPGAGTTQRTMHFRGDRAASYQASGGHRELHWWEPGTWTSHVGQQPTDRVPYELASDGMTESQFLTVAHSLRSIG